jgi:hypothetical protein
MESRKRANIANFSKIKLWHSSNLTTSEPPHLMGKREIKNEKSSMSRCQNFNDKHALK